MKVAKNDVDVQLDIPGATLRQKMNFGDVTGYGKISGEYFSLGAGLDSTDLFKGLEGDMCQSPHWGYVLRGQITTTDSSGKQETVKADDLFYWPPGHNIRVEEDADFIMFSPQHEHTHVINHLREKVTG